MSVERAVPGEADWTELAAPHLARYLFAAESAAGLRVLDAGCGAGYGVCLLRSAGAASVRGIDCDSAAIELARSRYGSDRTEFVVDDCQSLTASPGPFDLICCFENIEHLPRPEAFLAAAASRMSPHGRLLVSTPDRAVSEPYVAGRPRNPFHVQEWYRDEFQRLLQRYFCQVELRVQIQTAAVAQRQAAVEALRQGLTWANPLTIFLWRKLARGPDGRRSWKGLQGLAASSPGDWPIVPQAMAPLLGIGHFHVAICSQPRQPVQ